MPPNRTDRRLLVTDADNTLWDTNVQYARAQIKLLQDLERISKCRCNASDRLGFVRSVDQRIAMKDPLGLRYEPIKLADALWAELAGVGDRRQKERVARQIDRSLVEYGKILSTRPRLRRGVREAFKVLSGYRVPIVVLTEGGLERVERLLKQKKLYHAITAVICRQKTSYVFRSIRREWPGATSVVAVGDQIDRDIAPAIRAGFTALHFPSRFVPFWTYRNDLSRDVVAISDYRSILPVVLGRR